jgi:hypothetical protein
LDERAEDLRRELAPQVRGHLLKLAGDRQGAAAPSQIFWPPTCPDRPIRHVILDTTLIVRASCGASLR